MKRKHTSLYQRAPEVLTTKFETSELLELIDLTHSADDVIIEQLGGFGFLGCLEPIIKRTLKNDAPFGLASLFFSALTIESTIAKFSSTDHAAWCLALAAMVAYNCIGILLFVGSRGG